jgi:hypothetical protein
MPTGLPIDLEKTFVNEFGRAYCKLILHPAQHALVIEWYGYTTKKQVAEVTNWVETLIAKLPFDTIVNDCTYIISMWQDTIEWFSRIWLVNMNRLGVMRFAHVAKPSSFGEKIGQQLALRKQSSMEYIFFNSSKEASDWLSLHDKEDNIAVN